MPAPLLAADVPWLLYRSFFGLPKSITGTGGRPVNALLGTVNAILTLIDGVPAGEVPRAVVACMGAENAAYRVELYEPYHAHRDPMPPELREQWERAGELLSSLGWLYVPHDQLEADDVMFSYARAETAAGGTAWVMTGDRDLYGAVDERTSFVELRKGGERGLLGPAEVRERYGVEPGQVPDLIALRGDPSDGLPGAPGVGAKTAAELLRAHGSLEGVIAAAAHPLAAEPRMRPRIVSAVADNADLLRAFKQIATLQTIEVQRPPDTPTDFAAGAQAARAFGMRRLATRLDGLAAATA
ncbi:MAG TPA: 5'-3' exonuclease H3TH domain-containing protein [Solirubrobacteraceae bacterium]|nr:5'-3' exonuclease H3TH domain-containing protein [Solirubrobacteraceae bacterium]